MEVEWISVKDSLPPITGGGKSSDVVLVYGKFNYAMALLLYGDDCSSWFKMEKYSDIGLDNITHWMKLPNEPT